MAEKFLSKVYKNQLQINQVSTMLVLLWCYFFMCLPHPLFSLFPGFSTPPFFSNFSFLVFPWQPSMLFYTKTFMKYNEIIMFYCCAVMYYSNVITTFNQISICLKSHFCDYIFSYILDAFWCLYVPLNGSTYMTLMYNFNTFVVQIKAVVNQTFLISLFFLHIVLLPGQRVLSQ